MILFVTQLLSSRIEVSLNSAHKLPILQKAHTMMKRKIIFLQILYFCFPQWKCLLLV
jgi:hypothetical protein